MKVCSKDTKWFQMVQNHGQWRTLGLKQQPYSANTKYLVRETPPPPHAQENMIELRNEEILPQTVRQETDCNTYIKLSTR